MKQIWTIAKRELNSFFDSLLAYIMLIAFLGFTGLFTWLVGGRQIFMSGQASMANFFGVAYWTLFFFVPALTMKMVAEDKSNGIIELILTKPVSDWQFLTGKYLSVIMLVLISLLLTIPYYITIANVSEVKVDHGAIITGYLGLLLMCAAYTAIGIFTSSLTSNQIVALLLALLIGIFFHFVFDVLARSFPGALGNILSYLSISSHYQSITRGVVDSKDIIYFASIIFLGLLGAEGVLMKRNLSDN